MRFLNAGWLADWLNRENPHLVEKRQRNAKRNLTRWLHLGLHSVKSCGKYSHGFDLPTFFLSAPNVLHFLPCIQISNRFCLISHVRFHCGNALALLHLEFMSVQHFVAI